MTMNTLDHCWSL